MQARCTHVFGNKELWPERPARLCRGRGGRRFGRAARLFHRRPAGFRRAGKCGPRACRHQESGLQVPGPAHHGQPGPRRCAQDRPGVRFAPAAGRAHGQQPAGGCAGGRRLSGGAGAGRHPAPGIRRAAHGTGRRRKRHPRPVCARRKRRRGCRGLCRQHGRLPGPHRPGGGGRPARHPTADRCGSRSL